MNRKRAFDAFVHWLDKLISMLRYFWAAAILKLGLAPLANRNDSKAQQLRIIMGYDINCKFIPYLKVQYRVSFVTLWSLSLNNPFPY